MKTAMNVFALCMLLLCTVEESAAQIALKPEETAAPAPVQEITAAELKDKIDAISKRIDAAEADRERDGISDPDLSELQDRLLRLKLVKNTYALTLNALGKKEMLSREQAELNQAETDPLSQQLTEKPPYQLGFYDDLLRQAFESQQAGDAADLGIRQAKKSLDTIRADLERSQRELRLLRENIAQPSDEEDRQRILKDIANAETKLELDRAQIDLHKVSLENHLLEQTNAGMRLRAANRLLEQVRGQVVFDKDALQTIMDAVDRELAGLQKKIHSILRKQAAVRADIVRANTAGSGLERQGAALDAWDETWSKSLEFTESMVTLLNRKQQIWQWRFELINNDVDYESLREWGDSAERMHAFLDYYLDNQQTFHANLLQRISAGEMSLSQTPDPQIKEGLQNRLRALAALRTSSMDYLTSLMAGKPLLRRLSDDLSAEMKQAGPGMRREELVAQVEAVWNFELWAFGDEAITVKKVVSALLILILGIIVAKYFIAIVIVRLLQRTHLESGAVAAINKILFYCAILLVALLSFRLVNIPLTVFTFLGGAVAIGFGFGAQNLINNFISGLVIMAERPIKVDDMIEVDGHFARVEEIGARCTRIRTGENVHILVPNSSFLEKNIINWTLSDKIVRAHVSVSVAYGSPVREVERLMLKAAEEHSKVHKNPKPFVLFNDFGDNALVIELHFWLTMRGMMEIRRVASDIRFHLDELFREAGIVIAFPQRDVHLDTTHPLEVTLRNASDKP
jgi:small-conductance mechanosensitive channel